jgi:hypothetical protein
MFRAEQGIFRFKALKVIDFIGWRSVLNLSFGRACDGEFENTIITLVASLFWE